MKRAIVLMTVADLMVPVMAITIVPSFAFSPSPWPAGGIQGPVSIQIEVEAD